MIFAYHGYPWLIHRLTYRRNNHHNLHVRGYKEEGTTTTPFDMVMLNDLDRFHLVMDVIDRVPSLGARAATLRQQMADARLAARAYTREHGEDDPAITGWTWPRTRGLTVRVLVVNAGSSSLKLRLLDEHDAIERSADLPAGPAGFDTVPARPSHPAQLGKPDVSVTGSCTAEPSSPARSGSTTPCGSSCGT